MIVSRSHTVSVHTHDKLGAFTRTHGVSIDPHDPGDGPTVRLHIGWGVMRFTSNDVVVVMIKATYTRIVPKDRDDPGFFLFDS